MKRLFILVLLVVGAVGFAMASGQTESSGQKITIVHYHWTETSYDKINQRAVELFEAKHPNVTIKGEFGEWAGYWDKLATTVAANDAPDIIQMDEKYLREYADLTHSEGGGVGALNRLELWAPTRGQPYRDQIGDAPGALAEHPAATGI